VDPMRVHCMDLHGCAPSSSKTLIGPIILAGSPAPSVYQSSDVVAVAALEEPAWDSRLQTSR
jgi:hypothetical protein